MADILMQYLIKHTFGAHFGTFLLIFSLLGSGAWKSPR